VRPAANGAAGRPRRRRARAGRRARRLPPPGPRRRTTCRGGSMKKRLARTVGMGTTATVALALLTLGCVFAATTGPREALAARTQALRQTLSGTTPLAQTITASADWSGVQTALATTNGFGGGPPVNLTDS